ncbi:MAG: carbohydrate-binding family 9-like protein [Clostridia bacterium]|nr:carbohydrate-binding family 9-like protein [Clostridia bacterium]
MKPYHIVRMDKPDWSAVAGVEMTHQPWLADNGVRAWAQACHDGERLYVRMHAKEEKIRATLTEPLAMVCTDSCLEFFFAPDAGDERYLNFEWNPLGTLYLGFGAGRPTRIRQLVKDKDELFAPKPFTTDDGWGIEFSIPVSFIRLFFPRFFLEGEAAGNFYKCGDKTDVPHYLAWADLTSAKPDYHRRQDFGRLIFE